MLQENERVSAQTPVLSRIAKGERAALGELFASEASLMLGIALRIVRRRDLAEDVVQEAFVTVWHKAEQFDPAIGHPRAWIATIVRNKAINLVRDRSRMETMDHNDLEALGDQLGDADQAYERLPDSQDLKRCLGQLEPPKRRSILLAYVTGMSHGEVAATLKVPLGTAKAWIRRGLAALQECLQ